MSGKTKVILHWLAAVALVTFFQPVAARIPGLRRMPEYTYSLTDSDTVDSYRRAVDKLEAPAKEWMAETGLFLEDGNLDWMEKAILGKLAGKKHQVWFLTSPRMMDGVGFMDLVYAWMWSYKEDPARKLIGDVRAMEEEQKKDNPSLVPEGSAKAFKALVERSASDPQSTIGLALLGNYGKPRSESVEYPVPRGNSQLAMLCRLLADVKPVEQGDKVLVRGMADRMSLAASLVYGPMYAVSEAKLQGILRKYIPGMVEYMQDLYAQGVSEKPLTAPITALTDLVWGAPAFQYPNFVPNDGINSNSWYDRIKKKPFSSANFEWQFVPIEVLRVCSHQLLREFKTQGLTIPRGMDAVHEGLRTVPEKDALKWSVLYGGRRIRGSHVLNPTYYWEKYRQGIRTLGDTLDRAELEAIAAKALGIPSVIGRIVVDRGLYGQSFSVLFDKGTYSARLDDLTSAKNNRGVERIQIVFQKTPWDGFRFEQPNAGPMARVMNLDTSDIGVLAKGIPPGYVFRRRSSQPVVEFGPEVTVRKDED